MSLVQYSVEYRWRQLCAYLSAQSDMRAQGSVSLLRQMISAMKARRIADTSFVAVTTHDNVVWDGVGTLSRNEDGVLVVTFHDPTYRSEEVRPWSIRAILLGEENEPDIKALLDRRCLAGPDEWFAANTLSTSEAE